MRPPCRCTWAAGRRCGRCACASARSWARCSCAPRWWWSGLADLFLLAHRLRLELAVSEPLAQHLLVEFADARLRHLVDERELLRQPPLRHARAQVLAQVLRARRRALAQHDARE